MSSYQPPVKHNNVFSTVFNSNDYDITSSSKTDPILFNDGRYLKSSGLTVNSSATSNIFNSLVTNLLQTKQNVDFFSSILFSNSMTFDFNINMIYYTEISSLLSSAVSFLNIPLLSQKSYIFTFLIKPTVNSKFYIQPSNNVVSINGNSIPVYGMSNVSLPPSFNFIVQQITILNTSLTNVPNFTCLTSVSAY